MVSITVVICSYNNDYIELAQVELSHYVFTMLNKVTFVLF